MHRIFCLAVALLITSVAQAAKGPNIIVILADGLGWDDVGYNGGFIETPAIDGLVESGVKLDRFYVTPLGTPTRAGLMTGRDPIRLGITYSDIHPWDNVGVHPVEHFMPQTFRQAGYQTAFIGSWGLGHAQQTYHPNQRGLDDFWGQLILGSDLTPPYDNMGGADLQYNGRRIDGDGAYLPQWIGDRAGDYLRNRDKDRPVFLMLSFPSARNGDDAPAGANSRCPINYGGSLDDYSSKQTACSAFVASVEAMDAGVGKLLQTLDEEGMADDTLVLFMSDSGSAIRSHGEAAGEGLRGGRGQALEGGIHVPAAMAWPGTLAPGSRYRGIATMTDVFPTLAAAAGVQTGNERKLDGLDLWSAIASGKEVRRSSPVVFISEAEQYGRFQLTAFDEQWKLVQNVQVDLVYIDVQSNLYRNNEGVDEHNDLASAYPGEVQRLEAAIKTIRQQHPINGLRNTMVPPSGWRGPKDWAEYPIAIALLQDVTAAGSPPPHARRPLDFSLGEKGRLIYDCEIKWWSFGFCIKNHEEDIAVYDFHKKE